jgi:hypothetical protein
MNFHNEGVFGDPHLASTSAMMLPAIDRDQLNYAGHMQPALFQYLPHNSI